MRKIIVVVAAVACLLLLSGCESAAKRVNEREFAEKLNPM